MTRKWRAVTKAEPCPICHKSDWCGRSEDGSAVICMRAENGSPTRNGGYLYVWLDGAWREPERRTLGGSGYTLPLPPPPAPKIAPKWSQTRRKLSTAEVTQFIVGDMHLGEWEFGVRDIIGEDGMLECCIATAFGVYESKSHKGSVGIVMRDAGGDPVGVRFRNATTREKTSLLGGSDGLFFDWKIYSRKVETLYVVEGATDAICLGALGFDVVGRSSCSTGTEQIRQLINIVKPRDVVYVADNDKAKLIAGKYREAGRDGAIKLAKAIGKPYKLISPINAKDIREYILKARAEGLQTPQIAQAISLMVKDALIQR